MVNIESGWTRTRRGTLYEDHCPPNNWIWDILKSVDTLDRPWTDSNLTWYCTDCRLKGIAKGPVLFKLAVHRLTV